MCFYLVKWMYSRGKSTYGYVQASDRDKALKILIDRTKNNTYGHEVIKEVSVNDLAPLSICVNFINPNRKKRRCNNL